MMNQPRPAMDIDLHHHDPALSQKENARRAVAFHRRKAREARREGNMERHDEHMDRLRHLRNKYLL